ncbi:MAG: TolC family protein [Pseudomonadota bacterium]
MAIVLGGCAVAPNPLSLSEQTQRAFTDVARISADAVPLTKPLTLDEAIARGLLYNLDAKVQIMDQALQGAQLSVANLNMLPTLAANAGYTIRTTPNASVSETLFTGEVSEDPSFSEDRDLGTADLTFTWNVLDFGLSYYRAKQQADRVLIALERRRRVINNLNQQIETAYWEALIAQDLLPRIDRLIREAEVTEQRSARTEAEGLDSRLATLEFRRNLLQIVNSLKSVKSDLAVSKARLASLINLPPGTDFRLATPSHRHLPAINISLRDLQVYSLVHRPEVREEVYQGRISKETVNQEILKLFPGLSIIASVNASTDSLLFYNSWADAGVRATWNLFDLLRGPRSIKAAELQVDLSEARRLALTAAVLVQVSIGVTEYTASIETFNSAKKLNGIEQELLRITQQSAAAEDVPELERIQRSAQAIAGELARENGFVAARVALAQLLTALGLDLVPTDQSFVDLASTTKMVTDARYAINHGKLSNVIRAIEPQVVAGN